MPVYRFNSPLIERVDVVAPHPGVIDAGIVARQNSSADQLAKLRYKLAAQSITTLMDSENGQAIIRVRGLKDEKQLTRALQKAGISEHWQRASTEKDAQQRKLTFVEKVHDKSLFLSALFYDLGNIAFFVSGIQRGKHNPDGKMTSHDKSEFKTGAAFSVGDILMTIYGDKKGDEELQAAANSLSKHLRDKGIKIPEGAALNPDSLHQSGAMQEINSWMRRHIIHIKSLAEIGGGIFTIHAARKPDKLGNINKDKELAGYLIATGWLATLLLDKSHKPQMLDGDGKSANEGVIDKIANNPRGWVARPLAMANNVFNLRGMLHKEKGDRAKFRKEFQDAKSLLTEHSSAGARAEVKRLKARQLDYIPNTVSASSFLIAHTLFGMSGSKRPHETKDDREVMADLVLVSANMLAQQPEAVRKQAVEETADYISKLPHVPEGKEQVAAAINAKIDGLAKSGWLARTVQGRGDTGLSV